MIRYFTAGESHGRSLVAMLDGIPAGLKITQDDINNELRRRQKGYGRGGRMNIETDKVMIMSGVRWGQTIGSPISLMIENKDWDNNRELMSVDEKDKDETLYVTHPRPGHADLSGMLKYMRDDLRDIQERASARDTASRVAIGAICKKLLSEFDVKIYSFVEQIGGINTGIENVKNIENIIDKIEDSPVRGPDRIAEQKIIKIIDKAKDEGNTVGGKFCVIVKNVPPGLGSHVQWDLKLDGRLAQGVMSIQAVKGVEFGKGFEFGRCFGSELHDEIFYEKSKGYFRKTNNAGGIEGGISNGEDIVIHAVMKPIPTLKRALRSVDIKTKKAVKGEIVRSDVCAVPSCCVIAESVVGIEIAKVFLEKFSGDSIIETKRMFKEYIRYLKNA